MPEKKHHEKIKSYIPLEKAVTEILAINGRSVEPFIKIFNYSGENITTNSLGTLVGVFEVAERRDDSAYIVNFLASVAKKEYFNNPRRGAIESFEAALHKINLALAELVKHGNVAWLGKLHGALGVLEKNNLHFSVTGGAKILLLRNGSFSDISEGLASSESSAHPIKTFAEISSGRITPDDKIILASPELFTLLSFRDLEKNAFRMNNERFAQFLRTVLINELDMSGAIVIDIAESRPAGIPKQPEERSPETVHNVFSQQAFVPHVRTAKSVPEQPENENERPASAEYVDSKTGHIYVQGETQEGSPSHPSLDHAKLVLQNISHGIGALLSSQKKFLRKGKKQGSLFLIALTEQGAVISRRVSRFLRKQSRKSLSSVKTRISSMRLPKRTPDKERVTDHQPASPQPVSSLPSQQPATTMREEVIPTPESPARDADIPDFMKAKLAAFYQGNRPSKSRGSSREVLVKRFQAVLLAARKVCRKGFSSFLRSYGKISSEVWNLSESTIALFRNFPRKRRWAILGGSAVFLIALSAGIFFLINKTEEKAPAPSAEAPQPETSPLPIDTEKNARLLEAPVTIATEGDSLITSILLDNESYLVTAKDIVNVREQKRYPLPSGSGTVRLASPMDDLRLIFIYTDTDELFAWSPISRTFTKNTLTLPEEARVRDIGTYLTYLYVLDDTTDQIYRFPRAEGGFGASSVWLRDAAAIEEAAKIAVNETIFLAPDKNVVQAFFRGRFVRNLESPNSPLSITGLYTRPGLANVYVLDTDNKRILVWNQDGTLIAQYFSEQLSETKTITVDEKTSEAFITTPNALLSFKLGQ